MTTINLESFLRGNSQTTNTPEQSMFTLFQATQPQTSPNTPERLGDLAGAVPMPYVYSPEEIAARREDLRPNPAPAIALGVGVLLFLTLIRK